MSCQSALLARMVWPLHLPKNYPYKGEKPKYSQTDSITSMLKPQQTGDLLRGGSSDFSVNAAD